MENNIMRLHVYIVPGFILALSGCASIDFGKKDGRLTYFVPKPYLFVSVTKDCVSTVKVVSIPGKKKSMKLKSGYGSSNLTVKFENGIITSVGQQSDTKIPETITSIATLGSAMRAFMAKEKTEEKDCPSAKLYPIKDNGEIDKMPINFQIGS